MIEGRISDEEEDNSVYCCISREKNNMGLNCIYEYSMKSEHILGYA